MGLEIKDWAMKWIEGSIISCVRGRTPLNMVVGRIRRALNSYGLRMDEILALIDAVESNPVYLPTLSKAEKSARLKPIKEALIGLQIKPPSITKHPIKGDVVHG
jgi:hypothetical protein